MHSVPKSPTRVLVVGGGYVGLNATLRLLHRLRPGEAEITLVDPRGYMTYHPFLPEAAAGSIDARNVVLSLRRTLSHVGGGAEVVAADVVKIAHGDRTARIRCADGAERDLDYDVLVMAPGSVSRTCRSRASPSRRSGSRPSRRPSTCATGCSRSSTSRRRAPSRTGDVAR